MQYIKIRFCIFATLLCLLLQGYGKGWFGREVTEMAFVGGNAEKLGIKGLKINAATTVSTVERVPVTNL